MYGDKNIINNNSFNLLSAYFGVGPKYTSDPHNPMRYYYPHLSLESQKG